MSTKYDLRTVADGASDAWDTAPESHKQILRDCSDALTQAADEIEQLRTEIREGDYWQQRARAALENGTCPICFATDEVGHTATCPWGEDERDSDRLQDEVNELKRLVARADEAFRKYRKMMAAAEKARAT